MAGETGQPKDEAAIRQLVDRFVNAIRGKNTEGVMAVFAPDVVSFDVGPPLQHGGGEEFVKRWRELFDSYLGPIDYDVRELNVIAAGDVAFSYSLNRIGGTNKSGQKSERWLRWTVGYRKIGGNWRIVHEHVSVPVDARSGRAIVDLKP